jgi:hypothetical protein
MMKDEHMKNIMISNNDISLTITEDGRFNFTQGSTCWENSALAVVNYYDRQHPRPEAVMLPSSTSVQFGTPGTLSMSAKGFFELEKVDETAIKVQANFPQIDLSFPFTMTLDEVSNGFRILFESDDIVENRSSLYRILSVEFLPCFGAATTGDEGYLVLPNWCGSKMNFNHTVSRELRQTIYSSNDQWEFNCNMPVFGINRSFGTLSCVVAAGENDAKIVCRQHWEENALNSAHPEFVLRWEQQDELISGPRELRYSFAPAEYEHGEGYVHVGHQYRKWLEAERNLQSWDEKAATRPEAVDYRDRFFLKIFMGYKEPTAEGTGQYHSTCTFEETQEILEDLQSRGIKNICAILVGWGIDGHDGKTPTRFPVDERLGGEEGMRALTAWCKEQDIMLGVHDSYGGSYTCSEEHNTDDLIHHRSGEYWESVIWSGGQCHRICPEVYLEKHVKRDIPMISNLGIHGHHHIDAVGAFMPCYSQDHPLTLRSANIACNREMFKVATGTIGSVSTEMPFGSYFDVVDGFYHSYTHLFSWFRGCKAAQFSDGLIPLLALATHGSIKSMHSVSGKIELAHMAAYGLTPQAEVCVRPSPLFGVPAYDDAKERIVQSYELFYGESGLSTLTESREIVAIYEPAPDVRRICYEGNIEITANEGDIEYRGILPGTFQMKSGEDF